MIVSLAGYDFPYTQDQYVGADAPAFDINNFINAMSNTVNKIWGQQDTTAEQKQAQLATVSNTYAAQLQQVAKQNQTMILTVGAVAAAGLVAFSLIRKKK